METLLLVQVATNNAVTIANGFRVASGDIVASSGMTVSGDVTASSGWMQHTGGLSVVTASASATAFDVSAPSSDLIVSSVAGTGTTALRLQEGNNVIFSVSCRCFCVCNCGDSACTFCVLQIPRDTATTASNGFSVAGPLTIGSGSLKVTSGGVTVAAGGSVVGTGSLFVGPNAASNLDVATTSDLYDGNLIFASVPTSGGNIIALYNNAVNAFTVCTAAIVVLLWYDFSTECFWRGSRCQLLAVPL